MVLVPPLIFRHTESKKRGASLQIYASSVQITSEGTVNYAAKYDPDGIYIAQKEHFSLAALRLAEEIGDKGSCDFLTISGQTKVKKEIQRLNTPEEKAARAARWEAYQESGGKQPEQATNIPGSDASDDEPDEGQAAEEDDIPEHGEYSLSKFHMSTKSLSLPSQAKAFNTDIASTQKLTKKQADMIDHWQTD